ncbi:MAG: DUF1643 domain-containing protein [Patescibacteria group bacterium]
MKDLFDDNGATFSPCRKYRYVLWRIWDDSKPKVMFIGLNPSTANETEPDPTITRVIGFAKSWGYGGVYMTNCFPYVSTNPDDLKDFGNTATNDHWLYEVARMSKDIIFAWGAFDVVKELGRDVELKGMFPHAKALVINKDGSPRHPLYVKGDVKPVAYNFISTPSGKS